MDREKLTQYLVLKKEIEDISEKIKKEKDVTVTDIVRASNSEFPYQEIHKRIEGLSYSRHKKKLYKVLKSRLIQAKKAKVEIEEYIGGIDDSYVRYIFEKRYIDGWSWQKISGELGSPHESYARMIHNRFLASIKDRQKN
ncbi:hypothetical protein LV469_03030 [Peptoniphilus sp. GNH]|nr:hypothetical protein LV469_03030 [Peptoniphilus sp. GNH]